MTTDTDVQQQAEQAARHPWVERVGTFGFAAKGFLYVVMGMIAGSVGIGGGGGDASGTGAITQLSQESYGTVLLIGLAFGLAGYTALRVLHVVINPSDEDGLLGIGYRITYAVRAAVYGFLAGFTVKVLLGSGGGGGGGEQSATRTLLELPAGRLLVGGLALVLVGVGVHQLWSAATGGFMQQLEGAEEEARRTGRVLGTIGHAARGILYGTVGVLFGRAAMASDPSQAGGVDEALQTIAGAGAGTAALAALALGLAAYGAFCWAVAFGGTSRKAG